MKPEDRWEIFKDLGEGGQGKVFRVLDKRRFDIRKILPAIKESHHWVNVDAGQREKHYPILRERIFALIQSENSNNHGALKILHTPQDARDAALAEERIKKEIESMAKVNHPNLIKILDTDPDGKWFVSQFYPHKTLADHPCMFVGDFIGALKAIRPMVQGVGELHKEKIVHRDIKPKNIFLDSENNLVLGDFGLVFFADDKHTRVSATFENVGSRDWMPGWAQGMRIEDISFTFDVFTLGKTIWSMVSGMPVLPLWYFDKPRFNVEKLFPSGPGIGFANSFFEKCIVENKSACIFEYAPSMLEEIDRILAVYENHGSEFRPNTDRPCSVCHKGVLFLTTEILPASEISGWNHAVAGASEYTDVPIVAMFNCSHSPTLIFRWDGVNR